MNKYKKINLILLFSIFIVVVLLFFPNTFCKTTNNDLQIEMEQNIASQLGQIDLSNFDEIISNLDENGKSIFGTMSFWDKVNLMLNGEFNTDYGSFFGAMLNLFFSEILNFIPLLCLILAVTILCGLVGNLKSEVGNDSVGNLINFVCYGVVIIAVTASVFSLLDTTTSCINSLKAQMDLIFPILLTLLASVGGAVSVGVFQPTLAILSNIVVQIFTYFLIPLFIFTFIFIVVGHLTDSIKLDKFISLFNSIFKWIAGICFSLFMGAMVVGGVVAGSFDGVSIRATKFALKSYIPILGGYLSDGFNLVMASSVLIKNSIGLAGVILSVGTVLFPILQVIAFSLGLKLTASILEPITKSKVPNFLTAISKLLNMLVVILAGVGFMYIISVGLILCTANII